LAFGFFQVALLDSTPDLTFLRMLSPEAAATICSTRSRCSTARPPSPPTVSRAMHEKFGITYFRLNMSPRTSWETLEKLFAAAK
jgi:hypothetical protein